MTAILAYGDSLTWGSRPDGAGRHAPADRWPNVLASGLPGGVEMISEGLRGRTTCVDNAAASADMNGVGVLPVMLHTHAPLDLVMVLLGSNDVWLGREPAAVIDGLARLVEVIRHHPVRLPFAAVPSIMLIAPPAFCQSDDGLINARQIEISKSLGPAVEALAVRLGTFYFDARTVAHASRLDGVHLEADQTRAIGQALIPPVRAFLDIVAD
ncbi:MAG: lysophospholipase L1-like esterase [Paracoccaceae bacterium]|jgi:lysophospholipase L1-like esterase